MKKISILILSLFLTTIMQAQDRTQPKPGPSPKININKPVSFTLPNGLKVLVVENHKLPRVSFSLSIDNSPYAEGTKKGVADMVGTLLGNGSTKITKDAYNEEIDFLGANINFSDSGAYASGLSKYAKRILELMADGALNPNFTQEELDKEKEKLIEGLKSDEKSVTSVAGRVEDVLAYGVKHPAGEYISEQTVNNITLDDVKANYNSYFVPEHAYLVVLGDVKTKDVKKQVQKLFKNWAKATAPSVSFTNPKNVEYTQINFVDMPNAVQSEIAIINTVDTKISNPDYFPLLVANQVLGGDFNGYLNMNLREKHGWTYGSYSSVGFNKYIPSKFKANAQVRNAVTDSAVVEALNEIKRIRTEKVSDETLNSVKAGYIGKFVMQVEKPETVARYALNIEKESLPADFYENFIKNINAVTAEDVMRVANKYFLANNLRIIVTGKGSDVVPGLEKLKMPMFFFDKFGNPTEKPSVKKAVPAGVTVKTVLDNYIKAIGGEKAVSAVKTIYVKSSGKVQGMNLDYDKKVASSNKIAEGLSVMGQSMKKVYDGKTGYQSQGTQKKPLDADELASMKYYANPFPELSLLKKDGITITGIENINGADAYALKDGDKTLYYDVTTGLKLAEAEEAEMAPGKKVTILTPFSDYREVKGIKIPYKSSLNIGMEVELNVSDVKINEGVTDKDFE